MEEVLPSVPECCFLKIWMFQINCLVLEQTVFLHMHIPFLKSQKFCRIILQAAGLRMPIMN